MRTTIAMDKQTKTLIGNTKFIRNHSNLEVIYSICSLCNNNVMNLNGMDSSLLIVMVTISDISKDTIPTLKLLFAIIHNYYMEFQL